MSEEEVVQCDVCMSVVHLEEDLVKATFPDATGTCTQPGSWLSSQAAAVLTCFLLGAWLPFSDAESLICKHCPSPGASDKGLWACVVLGGLGGP